MNRAITIFLATGAYSGYCPVAPGTAGSVVGLLVAWSVLGPVQRHGWAIPAIMVFGVCFALSCTVAGRAEKVFGEHDSSRIVLDEVLGMVATMFLNPLDWPHLLIGFALFRGFDVFKPFPAGWVDQRVRGGTGVMLDDLVAAVYANVVLRIVTRLV